MEWWPAIRPEGTDSPKKPGTQGYERRKGETPGQSIFFLCVS